MLIIVFCLLCLAKESIKHRVHVQHATCIMTFDESLLLRAPASSPLFLTYISICAIFVCQDDFEHAYVCAAVSSLVILMLHYVA